MASYHIEAVKHDYQPDGGGRHIMTMNVNADNPSDALLIALTRMGPDVWAGAAVTVTEELPPEDRTAA